MWHDKHCINHEIRVGVVNKDHIYTDKNRKTHLTDSILQSLCLIVLFIYKIVVCKVSVLLYTAAQQLVC